MRCECATLAINLSATKKRLTYRPSSRLIVARRRRSTPSCSCRYLHRFGRGIAYACTLQHRQTVSLQLFASTHGSANLSVYGCVCLQHSNVYTLGKRAVQAHFKSPASKLKQQGYDIHTAGRGGETTYHGPGQLVMYPVINLRRLRLGARAYVETLEDCMVAACSHSGVQARVSHV